MTNPKRVWFWILTGLFAAGFCFLLWYIYDLYKTYLASYAQHQLNPVFLSHDQWQDMLETLAGMGVGAASLKMLFGLMLANWKLWLSLLLFLCGCLGSFLILRRIARRQKQREERILQLLREVPVDWHASNDPFFVQLANISIQKNREEILRNKKQQMDQRTLENLAHQMKSSLNAALLEAEMQEGDSSELISQLERLNKELSYFLRKSTISHMEAEYCFSSADLSDIIRGVLANMEIYCKPKGLEIQADLEPVIVYADPFWIQESLETLMKNAMIYSKEGSLFSVSLKSQDNRALIAIENETMMTRQEFEGRYSSLDYAKEHYGIGLDMAQDVIRNHFGSLEVSMKDNRYCVNIELPITDLEKVRFLDA